MPKYSVEAPSTRAYRGECGFGAASLVTLTAAILLAGLPAHAGELESVTDDVSGPFSYYLGQTVVAPDGGPFDDISFSFLSSGTPVAAGTIYLFTSPYGGTPQGLSSASYVATATASGSAYTFASSVKLQGDTDYYLYTNSVVPDVTEGGAAPQAAYSDAGDAAFSGLIFSGIDFELDGTSTSVPEPPALSVLGEALGILFLICPVSRRSIGAPRTAT